MSPDQIQLALILVGAAAVVFLLVLSWGLGITLGEALRFVARLTRFGRMAISLYDMSAKREKPWVTRAHSALGDLCPPPRKSGTLEGWSWHSIDRDPVMTVRVQDRSPDGRRLEGYIIGTPGTLQFACKARTALRLIDGWITLTPDDGPTLTLRSGDSLVVEPGFRGQWQNETIAHLNYSLTLS